ncbi:MAG: hypothetical protein P8L98_00130 [Planctomycetota bacterium]|nr:hypothetical protein [Planctomycetota bacterium]MDG2308959.1 hypothetical protein [Planctomycetota bacterium]
MLKITTSPRLLFLMVCAKVFTSCATPMVEEAQEGLTTEYGLDGYNADEVVIPL